MRTYFLYPFVRTYLSSTNLRVPTSTYPNLPIYAFKSTYSRVPNITCTHLYLRTYEYQNRGNKLIN